MTNAILLAFKHFLDEARHSLVRLELCML